MTDYLTVKPSTVIGLVLIVIGILILVFGGISFTKKNTAEIGPLKLEEQHQEVVPVPQMIGALSLAGGIFLVVLGSRK